MDDPVRMTREEWEAYTKKASHYFDDAKYYSSSYVHAEKDDYPSLPMCKCGTDTKIDCTEDGENDILVLECCRCKQIISLTVPVEEENIKKHNAIIAAWNALYC